jgi:uncharacterized protein
VKHLVPNLWVDKLRDIPLKKLKILGIRGLLIDIDNTLVAWDADEPHIDVRQWIKDAREMGFQVVLVTNNKLARVERMQAYFMVQGLSAAKKPTTGAMKKAMRLMKLERHQTAIIGDQIFTDVLGGNRVGLYTILVTPISDKEFIWTKMMRQFERLVLNYLKRKNLIR